MRRSMVKSPELCYDLAMRMISKKPTTRKTTAKPARQNETRPLVKGQEWRIATGHAKILHIGKTLVQYRFIKTGMVRGALEMKSITNFAEALKANKATLVG